MTNKTTIDKLKHNKCYCSIKGGDITLKQCKGFECSRWKSCMTKTNKDIEKDMNTKGRDVNGKNIQKGESW